MSTTVLTENFDSKLEQPPTSPQQFYVFSKDSGFWMIDLQSEPPRAINHTTLIRKQNHPEHSLTKLKIEDFLKKELGAKHIKVIREDSKLVFSTKRQPFCEWINKQTNEKCVNSAIVYNSQSKMMCKRHYSFHK
jgi:hypothetical protein